MTIPTFIVKLPRAPTTLLTSRSRDNEPKLPKDREIVLARDRDAESVLDLPVKRRDNPRTEVFMFEIANLREC